MTLKPPGGATVASDAVAISGVGTVILPTATSGTSVQTAITNLGAAGGEIVLAPGSHTWDVVPGLPRSITGHLKIRGLKGATIVLSSAAPRAFDFAKVADYDTFQNITIEDLTVDCNNVGGKHHVILGTYINGSQRTRLNFVDITVRNIVGINGPVDSTTTNHRLWVWIIGCHPASNEATQTSAKRITLENIKCFGGNAGFSVAGQSNDAGLSTNHYLDEIAFDGLRHDMLSAQTVFFASSNFQIGSTGFGDRCTVRHCVGIYSGDDGLELNTMSHAVVENVVITDPVQMGFYQENFRTFPTPALQRTDYIDCRVERTSALGVTSATPGRGWQFSNTNPLGDITLTRSAYHRNATSYFDVSGSVVDGEAAYLAGFNNVTLDEFRIQIEGMTTNPAASYGGSLIFIGSHPTTGTLTIKGGGVSIAGTRSGSFTRIWYGINFGSTGIFDIDGFDWTYNVTGTLATSSAVIALQSGAQRGTIKSCHILATNDAGANFITVGAGITNDSLPILLQGNNTSLLTSGNELAVNAGRKQKFKIERHNWGVVPAAAAITPGASAYAYQNLDMYPEFVVVRGGTVSLVEYSVDGSAYTDTGSTAGIFRVEPADYLRVTYSVVPTMAKIPAAR